MHKSNVFATSIQEAAYYLARKIILSYPPILDVARELCSRTAIPADYQISPSLEAGARDYLAGSCGEPFVGYFDQCAQHLEDTAQQPLPPAVADKEVSAVATHYLNSLRAWNDDVTDKVFGAFTVLQAIGLHAAFLENAADMVGEWSPQRSSQEDLLVTIRTRTKDMICDTVGPRIRANAIFHAVPAAGGLAFS